MKSFLSKTFQLTDEESELFIQSGKTHHISKKELLFQADRPFHKIFFIHTGIIRAFRIIDGADFTYYFFFDNEFAVDYQSFLTNESSPLFFETLTDTTYVEFSKQAIYELYERNPRFERVGRLMAEMAYLSAADRLKQHQTDDLKTRYQKLIQKNPALFHSVPQHYIASYLGVQAQSLSRIRAEISGKFY